MNETRRFPQKKALLPYLCTGLLLTAAVLLVYSIKGLVPFGTGTIDYFDGSQVALPNLFQWWDILHGRVSLFYDWYEALGTPILPCYLPDYLLLGLLPRRLVPAFPSLLVLMRVVESCWAMQFAQGRMFPKLDARARAVLGCLYGCCGFALKFYVIFIWLDFVLLMPLVCLGIWQLLAKQKPFWLVGSLAVCFALNVYLAAFVLLFVLLVAGSAIFALLPKANRGTAAWRLGRSVVQGVLLSAAMMLPIAIIELGSDRAGLVGGTLLEHLQSYLSACMQATGSQSLLVSNLSMLLGMGAPLLLLAYCMLRRRRRSPRAVRWMGGCLAAMALPILCESVNLAWHFGSYTLFPMRYGFMLPCLLLLFCGWWLAQKPLAQWWWELQSPRLVRGAPRWAVRLAAVALSLAAMALAGHAAGSLSAGGADQAQPGPKLLLLAAGLLFAAVYGLLARLGLSSPWQQKMLCALLAFQLTANLYAYLGPTQRVGSSEQMPEFVAAAAALNESEGSTADPLSRVKNPDTSLNNNYPLVLGQAALSGWTDGIWTDTIDGSFRELFVSLGYSTSYTRILDQGGTLFTDALIGAKTLVANWETAVEAQNYTLTHEVNGYRYYTAEYQLPAGLQVDAGAAQALELSEDVLQNQNRLYQLVSGSQEPLMADAGAVLTPVEGQENRWSLTLTVEGSWEVYLDYGGDTQVSFYLDGTLVTLPYYQRPYNKAYPTDFCNGLIDLGCFADQTLTIELEGRDGLAPTEQELAGFRVLLLDRQALGALCQTAQGASHTAAGRHMTWQVDAGRAGALLLLPVQYSSGWRCTRNGQAVEPVEVLGGLMALPLEEGENTFSLHFFAPGFVLGVALSGLGLAMTLALLWAARRPQPWLPRAQALLARAAQPLLALALGAALALVYLIPLLCAGAAWVLGLAA